MRANRREEQWDTLRQAPIWILEALGRFLLAITSPLWLPFITLRGIYRHPEWRCLAIDLLVCVAFWTFIIWVCR